MKDDSPVFWRSKLINLLRNNALDHDESEKKFKNIYRANTDLLAASVDSQELDESFDSFRRAS